MRAAIEAWETRNQLIHKREEKEQESPRRHAALIKEVRELQMLRDKACLVDAFLFLADCDAFIKKALILKLADYISMVKRPIRKSIRRWKNRYGVVLVRGWLRKDPANSDFIARSEALERRIKLDG